MTGGGEMVAAGRGIELGRKHRILLVESSKDIERIEKTLSRQD